MLNTSESALRAVSLQQVLRRGSASPGVVTASDGNTWVLKWTSEGMYVSAMEWLGLHLARACGLNAPDVQVMTTDAEFVQSIVDPELRDLATGSMGPNPALPWLEGAQSLSFEQMQRRDDIPAERLFAFDVLLLNVDRRQNNPNVMLYRDQPVIHDFGAALQLHACITGVNLETDATSDCLRQHCCFRPEVQVDLNWGDAQRRVLRDCVDVMPSQWLPADADRARIFDAVDELFNSAGEIIQRRLEKIAARSLTDIEGERRRARANRDAFSRKFGGL